MLPTLNGKDPLVLAFEEIGACFEMIVFSTIFDFLPNYSVVFVFFEMLSYLDYFKVICLIY